MLLYDLAMDDPRVAMPDPPELLRERLRGVRGLLLDMDGVILLKGAVLPGIPETLAELERRDIPFVIVTNTSLVSRVTLAGSLRSMGLPVAADQIVTALSASAAVAARRFPGQPLYLLASPDATSEFDGQVVLDDAEAGRDGATVAAVVVADAGEGFTHRRLNIAFRLLRRGARLVAVHRNPWWVTAEGEVLDSGAFVSALEYATRVRAALVGKPARPLFRTGIAALHAAGVGHADAAMVGDDVWTDIGGGRAAGLRTVFVLSGRHGRDDLDRASRDRRRIVPDAVARSLSEVVAALD